MSLSDNLRRLARERIPTGAGGAARSYHFYGARPPTKSLPGQRILVDCAILHNDQKVFVGVFDEFDIFQGIAIDQQ